MNSKQNKENKPYDVYFTSNPMECPVRKKSLPTRLAVDITSTGRHKMNTHFCKDSLNLNSKFRFNIWLSHGFRKESDKISSPRVPDAASSPACLTTRMREETTKGDGVHAIVRSLEPTPMVVMVRSTPATSAESRRILTAKGAEEERER